jgi:hypothetical protein
MCLFTGLLVETEWGCKVCIGLALDRDQWGFLVNKIMSLLVP